MQLRAATDPNRFARGLFHGLPRRYDLLAEVLSLGQNRRWRQAMVDRIALELENVSRIELIERAPRHVTIRLRALPY